MFVPKNEIFQPTFIALNLNPFMEFKIFFIIKPVKKNDKKICGYLAGMVLFIKTCAFLCLRK